MAEPNRGDSASARVLCEVVDEWLKVGVTKYRLCLRRDGGTRTDGDIVASKIE